MVFGGAAARQRDGNGGASPRACFLQGLAFSYRRRVFSVPEAESSDFTLGFPRNTFPHFPKDIHTLEGSEDLPCAVYDCS